MFNRFGQFIHSEVVDTLHCLLGELAPADQECFLIAWDQFMAQLSDNPAITLLPLNLSGSPVRDMHDTIHSGTYECRLCIDSRLEDCETNCDARDCSRRYRVVIKVSDADNDEHSGAMPFLVLNVFRDDSVRSLERQLAERRA